MLVYLATNLINGKQYVGYTTKTLLERTRVHIYKSKCKLNKHYFYLFKQALRKYGEDNFKWEVLEQCSTKEECCKKEIIYISKYNTISPNGYNLTTGGNGGILLDETKLKISNSLKNYYKLNGHFWETISSETRSNWAKKSWLIKKSKGYVQPSFPQTNETKIKMSLTKNNKNKIKWINTNTEEIVELSLTKMAEKTGLTIGLFSHIKQGRQISTKCGWKIFKE